MTKLFPVEAAAILGLSVSTVYTQIKKGKLKATRRGPRLLEIEEKEVERYKRENKSRKAGG